MNVKISLGMSSRLKNEQSGFFGNLFSSISLQAVEPTCPFCGNHLKNARCNCTKFKDAQKRFLAKYGKDAVLTTSPKQSCVTLMALSDRHVKVDIVPFNLHMLKSFDYGTTVKGLNQTWLVSLGEWMCGTLSFFIREKGQETVFRCVITDIQQKFVGYPQIRIIRKEKEPYPGFFAHPVSSRYHVTPKDTELDEIPYDDYLARLR